MPRETLGAHVGFQMAWKSCGGVFSCGACGCWLFRETDIVPEDGRAARVVYEDSDTTCCVPSKRLNAVVSGSSRSVSAFAAVPAHILRLMSSFSADPRAIVERFRSTKWKYCVQSIKCPQCHLFLGLNVTSAAQLSIASAEILDERVCAQISEPLETWLEGKSLPSSESVRICGLVQRPELNGCIGEVRGEAGEGMLAIALRGELDRTVAVLQRNVAPCEPPVRLQIDQAYLSTSYLRPLDSHTFRPMAPVSPLLCTGHVREGCDESSPRLRPCKNVLTYDDQLLSPHHCWSFAADEPSRAACYFNSVNAQCLSIRNHRFATLAQGSMGIADVFCADCGAQVGWKFDVDHSNCNENQVRNMQQATCNMQRVPCNMQRVP